MRIAITGVAGLIGSHLADLLLSRGDQVVGIDNLSMGHIANIEHNLNAPEFEFHQIDVRDFHALQNAIGDVQSIVHLAGFKIPRYGNAIETLEVNTFGTKNVLEVARATGARVLIASTSDVYGKNPNLPFSETSYSLLGPSTIARWSYAVSKLWDEHMAFAYNRSHNVPVTILRLFGTYGPRQHLSWWAGPQAVFTAAILKDEPVEIHGDGSQKRAFIYIADLVDGISRAVDYNGSSAALFNLGNTDEMSILELAHLIKAVCRTPGPLRVKMVPYSSFGADYEDVARRIPDITLARNLLGFHPSTSAAEGLELTVAWQRKAMGIEAKAVSSKVADTEPRSQSATNTPARKVS